MSTAPSAAASTRQFSTNAIGLRLGTVALLIIVGLAVTSGVVARSSPALEISGRARAAGGVLTLSGSGLPHGALAQVRIDDRDLASAAFRIDSAGAFVMRASVPALAPGRHRVEVFTFVDGAIVTAAADVTIDP